MFRRYAGPVMVSAAVRLVSHLNAARCGAVSIEVASHAITQPELVHHVVDPDSLLGLDPLRASELATALPLALTLASRWQIVLPRPGRLGSLRGPSALTTAALTTGVVVLPDEGGAAWLPHQVGPTVQWQVLAAERPASPPGRYEADRALSEVILSAARDLGDLGVVAGSRPSAHREVALAPGYPARSAAAADRAMRIVGAVQAARDREAELLHSYAVDVRAKTLRELEAAAIDLLCAACVWPA